MIRGETPYSELGKTLSEIRKRVAESIAEVSGAVEIDSDNLLEYENGRVRPSEDILDLLIAHFSVKEEEASRLWKMAGYSDIKEHIENDELTVIPQPIMLLPLDARVIYTDSMNVVIDRHGVVINFMQNAGPGGQVLPAARVGMSIEYAKKIADTLQQTIKNAEANNIQKNLPAPGIETKGQNKDQATNQ